MPIPISVSQNPPITIRTFDIKDGSGTAGVDGNGITTITNPAKAAMRIRRTEKTIIEMRAQLLSFHNPIAVAAPQIAGSRYAREAAAMNALNIAGEPGNCGVWPLGTNMVTTNTRSPKAKVSTEPSRDRIEITVTPVERGI